MRKSEYDMIMEKLMSFKSQVEHSQFDLEKFKIDKNRWNEMNEITALKIDSVEDDLDSNGNKKCRYHKHCDISQTEND